MKRIRLIIGLILLIIGISLIVFGILFVSNETYNLNVVLLGTFITFFGVIVSVFKHTI